MRKSVLLAVSLMLVAACFAQQTPPASHFDGNSWWAHVKVLADDSLEGRNTGSEGLRKAQAYAVEQLQKAGAEPAGTNGFYQPIRFSQFQVDETKSSLALVSNGASTPLSFVDDAFISSRATRQSVNLAAPLVFAGYGLKIPEKNLNELAGLDLKGKIVVYLAGSPADIPHGARVALPDSGGALEVSARGRRHRHNQYLQSRVHGYSLVTHFAESQSPHNGSC